MRNQQKLNITKATKTKIDSVKIEGIVNIKLAEIGTLVVKENMKTVSIITGIEEDTKRIFTTVVVIPTEVE